VSCPITAAMAVENGRLSSGQKLAMLGIGSGINCTMLGVEW
jgi:3-oxoacyl-[acyl-carrier-protein] synthase-3